MVQSIITPLTRQLVTYRHQALAAPTMLDDGTLAPSHVAGVLAQEGVQGRNRLFPPQLTLWTFLLQVLSPDGSCREARSEEHTSELQSLAYLVCRLLLEKKKKNKNRHKDHIEKMICNILI